MPARPAPRRAAGASRAPKARRAPSAAVPPPADRRQGIQSIEVGARLLQALADAPRPLTLKDLSERSAMSAAKAHRYLVSLARIGLVEQDPETGRYDLGPFALTLGLTRLNRMDALACARPVVRELADALEQTIAVAVWGNHGATIVQWQESSHPVSVNLRAGAVLPLLASSTGRCFAAYLPRTMTAAMIEAELREARRSDDPRLPQSRDAYEAILAEVRERGVARVQGTLLVGVHSFTAPVFDASGQIVLGLIALGHSGTFESTWSSPVLARLRERAAALTARLGGRAPGAPDDKAQRADDQKA
jgi:DNA-binding IclR family transcriptional regulator